MGRYYLYLICCLSRLVQPFGKWNLHEEIIWHKVTGGTNRYGSFVIHPYPNTIVQTLCMSSFWSCVKGCQYRMQKVRSTRYTWGVDQRNSQLCLAYSPNTTRLHWSSCPFPEEIPYRLMKLYSYENDLILDPFNGSGQTTKVAHHFGRRYLGIDLVTEYVELAKSRIE